MGAAGLLLNASSAKAGSVTYDFSTDPANDPNIIISGNNDTPYQDAGGNPGGFLALLYSINSTAEVVVFPDIDNGQTVASFKFECDLRIGNAQGNGGRPADGFSVNFARANDPVLSDLPASATGANMAMNGQPENGTGTGIAIGFDTWSGNIINDDPTGDIEGIIVRVDNKTILKYGMPVRNGACDDATSLQTGPYNDAYWTGGGDPHDPAAWAGLCWAHLSTDLDDQGKLTVSYKGKTILDHYQTTYFPSVGRLVLAGRTGGANENTHFDNIKITTVPSSQPLLTGLNGDALGFTAEITDSASAAVNSSTIAIKLNGNTITPASTTKNGLVTSIVYKGAVLQPSGASNLVSLTYKDANGNSYSATRSYTVAAYTAVPASFAVPATFVDLTKPGFKVAPYQVTAANPNNMAWTEEMFKGLHGPNIADLTQTVDGQLIDTNGYYTVTGVVNWDKEGGADGNFNLNTGYTDATLPGQPSADGSGTYNNDGEEVLTYVQFPAAGLYRMGVNSDDGFKVSALPALPIDVLNKMNQVQLGIFDAGRGASDTIFSFYIPQAGIYPMRLLWENGGSGANCEWFSVQADGSKILINDPDATNTTGIKAFYSAPIGSFAKSFSANGSGVVITLQDGSSQVTPASVKLTVNGATVTPVTAKANGLTTITYSPTPPFSPAGSTNSLTLVYTDGLGSKTNTVSFITGPYVVVPTAFQVAANLVDTTKPGFKVKPYQVASGQPNTMQWTEEMFLGLHGTNIADLTQTIDGQPIDANGYYTVTGVVNWDKESGNDGNFQTSSGYTDSTLPGQPAGDGSGTYNNDGEEVLTYMRFAAAGFYTMGVNSDDGFKVSTLASAPNDVLNKANAVQLGIFDAGRGAADTLFSFYVPQAGIYPFRLLWENGGSGANCEWFSVQPDGTKVLINDPDATNTTGIKAFYSGQGTLTYVSSVIPAPSASGIVGNAPITITINEGTDKVDTSSIKLSVNGAVVTAVPTKVGNVITVAYTPATALPGGSTINASLTFSAGGVSRTQNWSFRTTVLGPGTLFIEAEDFNFGHGQWLTNTAIGMTGPYVGGDYQDKGDGLGGASGDGSDFGIDYNDNNGTSDQAIYRPNTPVEAGKRNGPAGFSRGTFDVQINHNIGWTDSSEWMNYTRVFPTGTQSYKVYARMAHGDANARRGGVLSVVTSDPSKPSQTTTPLGKFSAPWTGGWDTWPDSGTTQDALIPMTDMAGADTTVQLSGLKTLRFQYAEGAGDFDFLAFIPQGPTVATPALSVTRSATAITITFEGTLESADVVSGPYAAVAGATSPRVITLPPTGAAKFYRAKK
ncbi:MAG: hypothetical protein JWM99_1717 [Verrucomicrobiales bacterium]|nr:hypothetical protein [Verrucomicrobiales bacterium]